MYSCVGVQGLITAGSKWPGANLPRATSAHYHLRETNNSSRVAEKTNYTNRVAEETNYTSRVAGETNNSRRVAGRETFELWLRLLLPVMILLVSNYLVAEASHSQGCQSKKNRKAILLFLNFNLKLEHGHKASFPAWKKTTLNIYIYMLRVFFFQKLIFSKF